MMKTSMSSRVSIVPGAMIPESLLAIAVGLKVPMPTFMVAFETDPGRVALACPTCGPTGWVTKIYLCRKVGEGWDFRFEREYHIMNVQLGIDQINSETLRHLKSWLTSPKGEAR
jgi:hypothetical protein